MNGLEVNAFTVAVEWILQRSVLNAEVSVYMGAAKKARGFDATIDSAHDGKDFYSTIRFVVDPLYVQDPEEAHAILEKLWRWIEKWNQVEVAKRY